MRIESNKSEINKPASEIFSLLGNLNNLQNLMPPQVTNWRSTAEECSFTLSGMATIRMKIIEKVPDTLIKISSTPSFAGVNSKEPLSFILGIHLGEISPAQCTGQFVFEASPNPMLQLMLEKPLTKFFNYLAEKMKTM